MNFIHWKQKDLIRCEGCGKVTDCGEPLYICGKQMLCQECKGTKVDSGVLLH